jgi:putative ABC transport system ATP-binding protein
MAAPRPSGAGSDLLIEVRDMTKVYGTGDMAVHALRGVSLDVRRGEFVAIMGPSGSGKSTFMHLLGCLDRPTSGSYRLAGQEVSRLSADELAVVRSRQIGFVFQSFNLLARTSALENVELPMLYAGVARETRDTRAKELLQSVGLGNRLDHKPSELSGGQQQRVAIARALANGVPLLMADEPTGNLDSKSSAEIMALFRRLNEQHGLTVVVVTHDMGTAAWSKRVVTFRDGRIVADTPVADAVPEPLRAAAEQAARAAVSPPGEGVRQGAPA